MKIKILLLYLILLPSYVMAYDYVDNGIYYNLDSSTFEASVTSGDQPYQTDSLVIPRTISVNGVNYNVTSIGNSAFAGSSSLTKVRLPSSLTSIGESAFYGCTSLGAIVIPGNVTVIRQSTFYGCTNLSSIDLGNVESIEFNAFCNCGNLKSITIPNSVTSIGWQSFQNCSITNVTFDCSVIPSLENIGGFYNVNSVVVGKNVTTIGGSTFKNCLDLKSISFDAPSSVTSIGSYAFSGCTILSNINLPTSLTSIGDEAFSGCASLSIIELPSGLTDIGERIFSGSSLTSVTIDYDMTNNSGPFIDCAKVGEVIMNGNTANLGCLKTYFGYGATDYIYRSNVEKIVIGDNVTNIIPAAVEFENLNSIQVGSGNQNYYSDSNALIEKSTKTLIKGCKNAVIPSDIKIIGEGAFYGCSGLTSVIIPNSVTSIGGVAFTHCI